MEHIITCGKYSAKVLSAGAELVSFSDGEKEYVWTGDPAYWNGHNPNLFPVIGRMKGGKVSFNGVEHEMPKHGFARKREFALVSKTENSVTLAICEDEDSLIAFPFKFIFTVTHRVFEGGFETVYSAKNNDTATLYYNVGGHPGINLPSLGAETVEGCKLIFDSVENPTVWYGDESLFVRDDYVRTDILNNTDTINCTQEMFAGDALMIGNLKSNKVRLVSPAGCGVEMDFTGYPVMAFWTPPAKNAPFICLEPWHGLPANTFESGEFSEKAFAISLAPNEEKSLSYSVKLV